MRRINAQLYSVKDETEKNYLGTLEKIAIMGYKGVEFAGYGGFSAEELKEKLTAYGLEALSSHVGLERLENHLDEEIAFLTTLGARYIICPWADIRTVESALAHAKLFNEIGKKCAEAGLIFAYHNHDHELVNDNGSYPLEVLFENTDRQYVMQQPDLFWVAVAGLDAEEYLIKNADRCPIVHLKQLEKMGEKQNVEAAEGIIDFNKLMTLFPQKDYIYEQESFKRTSLESMERSLRSLIG